MYSHIYASFLIPLVPSRVNPRGNSQRGLPQGSELAKIKCSNLHFTQSIAYVDSAYTLI